MNKKLFALLLALLSLFAMSNVYAAPERKLTEFNVLEYPLTMVKSEAQIVAEQAIANLQLKADLIALYNSEEIKPQMDKLVLGVLKSLEESDDTALKAAAIAKDTDLPLEDAHILVEYTERFNIPNALVLALIQTESDFNKYLVSSANDRGYMQIIPGTERWLAREYGAEVGLEYDPSRIFDAEYQFGLGTSYLKVLFDKHGQDVHKVLSEYNRGPSNLKAYYRRTGTYHTSYSEKVVGRMAKYEHLN